MLRQDRGGHAGHGALCRWSSALNAVIDDAPPQIPHLRAIQAARLPVIDLFDVFPEAERPALRVAPWDDHPNAAGHRLIADRLYGQLLAFLTRPC